VTDKLHAAAQYYTLRGAESLHIETSFKEARYLAIKGKKLEATEVLMRIYFLAQVNQSTQDKVRQFC